MNTLKRKQIVYGILFITAFLVTAGIISCSAPMELTYGDVASQEGISEEDAEPVGTGLTITVPRFSPFFEAAVGELVDESGDTAPEGGSSKAFAVADEYRVTVYNSEGTEIQTSLHTTGAGSVVGSLSNTISLGEGTGYSVTVDIYNTDVSTGTPVVSGTATGIDIIENQTTPATVICLPVNPTPVPWESAFILTDANSPYIMTTSVDGGGNVLATGGEYWVSFTAPASGALRIHPVITNASGNVDLVLGLFYVNGVAFESFAVSQALDADGAVLLGDLSPDTVYYGGFIPISDTQEAVGVQLTFESLATSTTYSVTYSAADADTGSVPTDNTIYVEGDTVTVLGPGDLGQVGHTFAGWDTVELGGGDLYGAGATFDIGAGDVTLYAQWTPNSYTLTYYGNEHTGGDPTAAQTLDYGESITLPGAGDLVKTGYHFTGWDIVAAGSGSNYPAGGTFTMGDADEELFAQWEINIYTVSFDSRGGTAVDTQTINHGDTASEPTAPTRQNYTFDGWYEESIGTTAWDFAQAITEDRTLYAKWLEHPVTGVSLDISSLTLSRLWSHQLNVSIEPVDATNQDLIWSSSDDSYVSVDQDGRVYANETGSATITVETADGGFTAECTVTVESLDRIVVSSYMGTSNNDIYSLKPDGTGLVNLTNDEDYDGYPRWAPDGTSIYFYSNRGGLIGLYRMDPDGRNIQFIAETGFLYDIAPDGSKIVFIDEDTDDSSDDLFLVNTDGTGCTQLTDGASGNISTVKWSPDGTMIAFTTDRTGNSEVFTIEPDGSNEINRTTSSFFDYFASWSYNGRFIGFTTNRDGQNEAYEVDVTNSDLTRHTNTTSTSQHCSGAYFSPVAGSLHEYDFYFSRSTSSGGVMYNRLYRLGNEVGGDYVEYHKWAPDGTKVMFLTQRPLNGDSRWYIVNPDGTGEYELYDAYLVNPDWYKD